MTCSYRDEENEYVNLGGKQPDKKLLHLFYNRVLRPVLHIIRMQLPVAVLYTIMICAQKPPHALYKDVITHLTHKLMMQGHRQLVHIRPNVGTETDVSSLSLERECYALREEKHKLYKTIESFLMSIEIFESDKKRLKFYTGLVKSDIQFDSSSY